MNQFENIDQIREYVDTMKGRLDDMGLPEEDWKVLCEFLIVMEKMLADRECLFTYLGIIKKSFSRMSDIVGTEWDEKLLASMNKTLEGQE